MILAPVKVILDRRESQPGDFVRLRRQVDLPANVLLSGAPEDPRHDVEHRPVHAHAIGVEKTTFPPLRRGVRLQAQEKDETVEIAQTFVDGSAWDRKGRKVEKGKI